MFIETLERKRVEKERQHKVCRSRGGESCAFDGAMIVLQPIADAVHLVHGPISCAANSFEGRGTLSERGSFHKRGFTTDLRELDLIVGSEQRLLKVIEEIVRETNPQAVFVYSTCVTGLLGEDLERICSDAQRKIGVDIIPVNAPGFIGPKNLGNRIAGEVLLDYVIGKEEPPFRTDRDINIIGEYNIAGDQYLIEPLLEEAGFRILSRITGNATFREIKWAHRAKLNVIVCSRALVNIGIEMEKKYGIPYVEVSFFGKTEIAQALRKIAGIIDRDGALAERVERLILREEEKLKRDLRKFENLLGKRAVLYTGGVKSWSMISALKDIGIDVVGVGTKKSTYEDEEKIKELVSEDCLLFEDTTPANILKIMKEKSAEILVAGGRNLYLGVKEGIPFVDVNQERHRPYAGYRGLLNLAEDISKAIEFYSKDRVNRGPLSIKIRKGFIDPLKNSPFVGAAMALQGIDGTVPLLHTAQGCNFLGKVLLIKHFREPIVMNTTKLFTEEVVMGGEEKLRSNVLNFKKKGAQLVAVITGALSQMKGEEIEAVIAPLREETFKALHIPVPDYEGSIEYGYAKAVDLVLSLIPERGQRKRKGQINIIVGGHLTPADFSELREIFELFGLKPLILPDLSHLDGSRGFSGITKGGITLSEIEEMASSEFTVVIGRSLKSAGEMLKEKFGIEYRVFDSLMGVSSNDELFEFLSLLAGREISEKIKRQRRILIDAMRDSQFYLARKKAAVATEPDLAFGLSELLNEAGIDLELVVLPIGGENLDRIQAMEVIIGSLSDLEGDFELILSNSHAEDRAKKLGAALLEIGFPVYKSLGYPNKVTIGYRGSLNLINEMANLIMKREVH
ncbi:nitrogenase iron-molybdenum cofactor biosynthesis protein NifE [Thermodesulfovibrio yellowstonii]|uniref:NifEN2 n=1 Tax=Thermodesulfovibrio yellowstonii TaxID=28262 RepID=A0A9W6GFG1_9BACT|nr:nitrogenase iron-molybdenum cofactor biosynthesis protein NifE [Thermodesulfovibrio islandicus]GLI52918.1 NifEN2 [Thermodesulfovibrio islandicus]